MQDLLKLSNMEQFASIFKQNNISVGTFIQLVNKDTPDEEKS